MNRTQTEGFALMPGRAAFNAGPLQAQTFFRLSPSPSVGPMPPADRVRLHAAWAVHATHYLPYCSTCGETVHMDTSMGGLRTWLHKDESAADHVVGEALSAPDSYAEPADALRYLVMYNRTPLAWVLYGGTVYVPRLLSKDPTLVQRQRRTVASL